MRAETRVMTLVLAAVAAAALARSVQAAPAENGPAKAAFVEGERNFQLGKFEAAIEAYERAFGLDPQPAFLFNIALAHRRQYEIDGKVEHLARARELYRNYLKLEPQSGNRAGVEKLIGELTAKIDQERARSPEPAPSRVSAPEQPGAAEAAVPPVRVPAANPPPASAAPAALLSTPARETEPPMSSNRKWIIGGTIAAAAVVAAIAVIFVVTREGPSFDGPGVTLR